MERSFDSSKFTSPSPGRILHRRRLLKCHEQNRHIKLVLVLGRAAQGKSTLASAYTGSVSTPFAWLNREYRNSDVTSFRCSMVHSIFQSICSGASLKRDIESTPTHEAVRDASCCYIEAKAFGHAVSVAQNKARCFFAKERMCSLNLNDISEHGDHIHL